MLNKNILLLKLVFLLSVNILNNLVSCSKNNGRLSSNIAIDDISIKGDIFKEFLIC